MIDVIRLFTFFLFSFDYVFACKILGSGVILVHKYYSIALSLFIYSIRADLRVVLSIKYHRKICPV